MEMVEVVHLMSITDQLQRLRELERVPVATDWVGLAAAAQDMPFWAEVPAVLAGLVVRFTVRPIWQD